MLTVKNTEKKVKIRETGSRKISRSRAGSAALLIFLIITGSLMFLPFLYAIIQSVKPVDEIFIYPPRFFVTSPTGDNYLSLFDLIEESRVPFTRYLWNSAFVTLIATGLHVIFASMAAFPLAKFKFPGSKGYFDFIVVSLLFTTQVTALPLYIIAARPYRYAVCDYFPGNRLFARAFPYEAVYYGDSRRYDRGCKGGRCRLAEDILANSYAQRKARVAYLHYLFVPIRLER